jgi:Na+/proline symporter
MGMPRRIAVKGMQGVDATVVVTVVRGTVWLSISPPFTWEAIMQPGKVDEVIHVLKLARDEATKAAADGNGSTPRADKAVRAVMKNTTKP